MGRTGTYHYQVQIETFGHLKILAANSYKGALEMLLEEAQITGSKQGYIWPQTKLAKKKIKADYLEVKIAENTKNSRRYSIEHKQHSLCQNR